MLNHCSASVAAGSNESSKALAKTSLIVALSTTTALVAVVVRLTNLGHVLFTNSKIETINLGCATITALVILNNKKILFALDIISNEGNINVELVGSWTVFGMDLNSINYSVRQLQKGILNLLNKVCRVSGGRLECNRSSSKGFIKLGLEGKGKRFSIQLGKIIFVSKADVLNLVLQNLVQVVSLIHQIITPRAQTLRAINVTILGVADASTGLLVVPLTEREGVDIGIELSENLAIERAVGMAKSLNVLAVSMAGAIIGASGSLASLSFVSLKAFAFTSNTVADTLVSTFSILVEISTSVRSVYPRKLKGADTVRAITGV